MGTSLTKCTFFFCFLWGAGDKAEHWWQACPWKYSRAAQRYSSLLSTKYNKISFHHNLNECFYMFILMWIFYVFFNKLCRCTFSISSWDDLPENGMEVDHFIFGCVLLSLFSLRSPLHMNLKAVETTLLVASTKNILILSMIFWHSWSR